MFFTFKSGWAKYVRPDCLQKPEGRGEWQPSGTYERRPQRQAFVTREQRAEQQRRRGQAQRSGQAQLPTDQQRAASGASRRKY